MGGLDYDLLPEDIKAAISAEAGDRAEAEGLQREYGELIEVFEVTDTHNKGIVEEVLQSYIELKGEGFGDC